MILKLQIMISEVERIKEWLEKKKREDELVNLLTGEGPELPKPTSEAATWSDRAIGW